MSKSSYTLYTTTKEAWQALFSAISSAKKSIYWELYIFIDDEVGMKFFDVLEEKARGGVEVRLLIDSWGSMSLSKSRIDRLKSAGVDIRLFSDTTKRIRSWWRRLWLRTHRKILVVDETVGYIGGVNIQKHMEEWQDIQLQITGEAVHALLYAFAKAYVISGGDRNNVRRFLRYRRKLRSSSADLKFVFDNGLSRRSRAKQMYTTALYRAKKQVILFTPYYFPDKKFLFALWQARKRGVRVDLLLPLRPDVRIAAYAAYGLFSLMQTYGVHVHLSKEMMHGKGVIVDDDWAMVGSSNIDHISFHDNYEANVKISDKHLVRQLKERVVSWAEKATPLDEQRWKRRGVVHRSKEKIATWMLRLWHWRARG